MNDLKLWPSDILAVILSWYLVYFCCRQKVADALMDTISSLNKFEQGIKDCLEVWFVMAFFQDKNICGYYAWIFFHMLLSKGFLKTVGIGPILILLLCINLFIQSCIFDIWFLYFSVHSFTCAWYINALLLGSESLLVIMVDLALFAHCAEFF